MDECTVQVEDVARRALSCFYLSCKVDVCLAGDDNLFAFVFKCLCRWNVVVLLNAIVEAVGSVVCGVDIGGFLTCLWWLKFCHLVV